MSSRSMYLRAAEIALLTGLSERSVRRRLKDKTLTSSKIGGARLIARADLERLLSSSSHVGENPAADDTSMDKQSEVYSNVGKAVPK